MSALRLSLLYSFSERYLLLLLATLGSMALARLLTPAEIGIYSVAAVLVGLAQVVRDFGVGQYLIQERELTPDKLRAALGASLLVAWPLAALLLLLAAPLAGFYRQPGLRAVLQLLAINVALVPFSAVASPSTITIAPISKLAQASVEAITVAVPTVGTELTDRLFAVPDAATVNTPERLVTKTRPPLMVKIV